MTKDLAGLYDGNVQGVNSQQFLEAIAGRITAMYS